MTSRITLRVRNLLLLIPTDPEVQDALDNFVPKESSVWSHQVHQTKAPDLDITGQEFWYNNCIREKTCIKKRNVVKLLLFKVHFKLILPNNSLNK